MRVCARVCVCILRESGGVIVAFLEGGGGEGEGQHTKFMELDMKRSSSGLCLTLLSYTLLVAVQWNSYNPIA